MAKTEKKNNPNGFTTEREVDGERRCVRHYNDGRVSSRDSSRRRISPPSSPNISRCRTARASSRPTSHSTSRSTSRASSDSGSAGSVELISAVEKLEISDDLSVEKLHGTSDPELTAGRVALEMLESTSRPASVKLKSGDGNTVLHRVAEIETQLNRLEKCRLVHIPEEEEEQSEHC